jgi:hypothetical protein
MAKAEIISRKGKASLIKTEHGDMLIIPADNIASAQTGEIVNVSREMLEQAIPYGAPFSSMIGDISISSMQIEEALHTYGIWTVEDFDSNSNAVIQALQSVISATYHKIYQSVHSFSKENLR